MKNEQERMSNKKVFENKATKKIFQKGLKYLALALPLLFASPVIVTIGFKALNKGGGYLILILGCVLILFTIAWIDFLYSLSWESLLI